MLDSGLGFILERAWEVAVWLRDRESRAGDSDAAAIVRRIRRSEPWLLSRAEEQRLERWLLDTDWSSLPLDPDHGETVIGHLAEAVLRPEGRDATDEDPDSRGTHERAALLLSRMWTAIGETLHPRDLAVLATTLRAEDRLEQMERMSTLLLDLTDNHSTHLAELSAHLDALNRESRDALPLQPPRLPVSDLDHRSPATVLRPRYALLPLTGRGESLARLRRWALSDARVSVSVITGHAGAGKSRLAVELCTVLNREGWTTGFLLEDSVAPELTALGRWRSPKLIVVDYSEHRTHQVKALVQRLHNASTQGHPCRVLLLSRSAGAGDASHLDASITMGEELANARASGFSINLDEAKLSLEDRHRIYSDTVTTLVRAGRTHRADLRSRLVAPGLDTPLLVAALAVMACTDGALPDVRSSPARSWVIDAVLMRERSYWESSSASVGLNLDAETRDEAIFVGLLAGDSAHDVASMLQGVSGLGDLSDARRRAVGTWLAALRDETGSVLQPDLLVERHLADCVQRNPGLLGDLMTATEGLDLGRSLLLVDRAAQHQQVVSETLRDLLDENLERYLDHCIALLEGMDLQPAVAVAEALATCIETHSLRLSWSPDYENLTYLPPPFSRLAAMLAVARFNHFADSGSLSSADEVLEGLMLMANVPGVLQAAGLTTPTAIDAGRRMIDSLHQYQSADPNSFLTDSLITGLLNLSGLMQSAGRKIEALAAAERAGELARLRTSDQPDEASDEDDLQGIWLPPEVAAVWASRDCARLLSELEFQEDASAAWADVAHRAEQLLFDGDGALDDADLLQVLEMLFEARVTGIESEVEMIQRLAEVAKGQMSQPLAAASFLLSAGEWFLGSESAAEALSAAESVYGNSLLGGNDPRSRRLRLEAAWLKARSEHELGQDDDAIRSLDFIIDATREDDGRAAAELNARARTMRAVYLGKTRSPRDGDHLWDPLTRLEPWLDSERTRDLFCDVLDHLVLEMGVASDAGDIVFRVDDVAQLREKIALVQAAAESDLVVQARTVITSARVERLLERSPDGRVIEVARRILTAWREHRSTEMGLTMSALLIDSPPFSIRVEEISE